MGIYTCVLSLPLTTIFGLFLDEVVLEALGPAQAACGVRASNEVVVQWAFVLTPVCAEDADNQMHCNRVSVKNAIDRSRRFPKSKVLIQTPTE